MASNLIKNGLQPTKMNCDRFFDFNSYPSKEKANKLREPISNHVLSSGGGGGGGGGDTRTLSADHALSSAARGFRPAKTQTSAAAGSLGNPSEPRLPHQTRVEESSCSRLTTTSRLGVCHSGSSLSLLQEEMSKGMNTWRDLCASCFCGKTTHQGESHKL